MGWWRPMSLRGKLMLSILLPAAVVITAVYIFSVQDMMANFDREYRERARAITQTLQSSITTQDFSNLERLQGQLRSLARANAAIHRLSIYAPGAEGTVLASTDASLVGVRVEAHDIAPLATGEILLLETRDGNLPLMEANAPLVLEGRPMATLGVYMSLTTRNELIRSQQVKFVLVGGGGLSLLLLLVYLLAERLIVQPVEQVSRATTRIARGDLETRVPDLGQDEVGMLAKDVNLMMEEIQEDRAHLERLATTDGLTELWNHRYFHERMRAELNRAIRRNEPVALLMMDLDRFKAFNDTYGHLEGDKALKKIGGILRGSVRPYDVPCRYGGEEFTVIVPGTDSQGAKAIAERIRQRVAEEEFDGSGGQRVPLTASFGVASYPQDDGDAEGLLRAADTALYVAKRSRGNTVRAYGRALEAEATEEPLCPGEAN